VPSASRPLSPDKIYCEIGVAWATSILVPVAIAKIALAVPGPVAEYSLERGNSALSGSAINLGAVACALVLGISPTWAQPRSSDAKSICVGIADALLDHAGTKGSLNHDGRALGWTFDTENVLTLRVRLTTQAERLAFANFDDCVVTVDRRITLLEQAAAAETTAPSVSTSPPNSCIIEVAAKDYDVSDSSPEMGGGHTQPEWCSQVTQRVKGRDPTAVFTVVSSSESSHSTCSPFNCPAYTYHCTVHVHVPASSRPGSPGECLALKAK